MNARGKLIISASRRTDLVAWFPDVLYEKLMKIGLERIHTLVIWTKDPSNLLVHGRLRETIEGIGQVFCHLTVTGLGGTFMEPGVPEPEIVLERLKELVSLVGGPERIRWRYDPIVRWKLSGRQEDNLAYFDGLASEFTDSGINKCITSICAGYPRVLKRFKNTPGVEYQAIEGNERARVRGQIEEKALKMGIGITWCCEEGRPSARCINGELLNKLHPGGEIAEVKRSSGQRERCGCTLSWDIGWYNQVCLGGCKYCYANPVTGEGQPVER